MVNNIKIKGLLKAIILSLIMTIVLLGFTSILLRFTKIKESKLEVLNNITMVISIFLGSIYLAFKIRENGWLYGSILGGSYYLIIVILNIIFVKINIFKKLYILRFILAILLGAISGIIGINLI